MSKCKAETKDNIEMLSSEITIERKNSVLIVASEANPFVGTGGLADVIGSLPKAMAQNDEFDIRVVLPLYKNFSNKYRSQLKICYFALCS